MEQTNEWRATLDDEHLPFMNICMVIWSQTPGKILNIRSSEIPF